MFREITTTPHCTGMSGMDPMGIIPAMKMHDAYQAVFRAKEQDRSLFGLREVEVQNTKFQTSVSQKDARAQIAKMMKVANSDIVFVFGLCLVCVWLVFG